MSERESCAEFSQAIGSLLLVANSDQFWDVGVLQPNHRYWLGGWSSETVQGEILRSLAHHHAEMLESLECELEKVSESIFPYHAAITRSCLSFGLEPPRRFANYHQFALQWLGDFVARWRGGWSDLLNPVFPYVDRFDPRKLWDDPTWDGIANPPMYRWSDIANSATALPTTFWEMLAPSSSGLFVRANATQRFPRDLFNREANCLRDFLLTQSEQQSVEHSDGINDDEKTFTWGGVTFDDLAPRMLRFLRVLFEEFRKGSSIVSRETLETRADVAISGGVIGQVFKVNRKNWIKGELHPVHVVVEPVGNTGFRLIDPMKVPDKVPERS